MVDILQQILDNYALVVAPIIVLMSILISLTYMAAKLFSSPELEAYVNIELREIVTSAIILIFSIGFFQASDSIARDMVAGLGVAVGQSDTLPTLAIKSIDSIRKNVLDATNDAFLAQICLSIQSTLQRRIGEYVLTLSYKLFPGVDSMVSVINVVGYGLITVYGSLSAQIFFLSILDVFVTKMLLASGIVLRFFPPTRQAAVFLIAAAIAFQVVYPLTYIVNMQIMNEGVAGLHPANKLYDPSVLKIKSGFSVAQLCGTQYVLYGGLTNTALFGTRGLPFFSTNPVFQTIFNTAFSEFGINLLTPQYFFPIMNGLAAMSLPALFMPALAMTIAIAFINGFTKILMIRS